jgi:hypothetical protein
MRTPHLAVGPMRQAALARQLARLCNSAQRKAETGRASPFPLFGALAHCFWGGIHPYIHAHVFPSRRLTGRPQGNKEKYACSSIWSRLSAAPSNRGPQQRTQATNVPLLSIKRGGENTVACFSAILFCRYLRPTQTRANQTPARLRNRLSFPHLRATLDAPSRYTTNQA